MYSLMSRALGVLVVVALVILVMLGQWAVDNPVRAAVIIPGVGYGIYLMSRVYKMEREAVQDARLREEHVPSMSPIEYELFAARQLERAGWTVLHCGAPGDQGCDVLAELRGFRAVVQVKKYSSRAGNEAVQQAAGARGFYKAQVMVVVAPNGFTRAAQALAASCGVHLLHHNALHTLERAARIP